MKKIKTVCLILCLCVCTSCLTVSYSAAGEWADVATSKKIALTFDDGPHPRYTYRILEILDEYGVTATFFIIGVNA